MPRAPVVSEQVDVQVRGMLGELRAQHPLRVEHGGQPVVLPRHQYGRRRAVPGSQPRQPLVPVGGDERLGVRGADHVADGLPVTVIQHVGVLPLQDQVRAGEDIGDELVAAVQAASALPGLCCFQADVVDRVPVAVTVTADERRRVLRR